MTRAEKRRKERQKTATYNLTAEQIETIKENAVHEATLNATKLVVASPAMVLHDVFGFGNVRLTRFAEKMCKELDCFSEGRFSVKDAEEYVNEHCNVVFK